MSYLLKEIAPAKNDTSLKKLQDEANNLGPRALRRQRKGTATAPQPAASQFSDPQSLNPPHLKLGIAATGATSPQNSIKATSAKSKPQDSIGTGEEQSAANTSPTLRDPMSSQRSRPGRSNPRGASEDKISPQALWSDFHRDTLKPIMEYEARAKQLRESIIETEATMKRKTDSGIGTSLSDHDGLDSLYREGVKLSDEEKVHLGESMRNNLTLMIEMMRTKEQAAAEKAARAGSRTTGLDFDGPSDSPIPSPADNRQIKKIGTSRTGSQPPNRPEGTPSEANERTSKPKITYVQNEEVAFKRKTPGKPEEQDWILGKVVRVIGEGKSRRYEVEDPFPDTSTSTGPVIYKSSASQMVPIPAEGSPLEDYELGKRVLALYPDTTTFYRAEVKAMLNGGADVQLLFEDEAAGELKVVTRRLVLDHKG